MEDLLFRIKKAGIKLKVVDGQLKVSLPAGANHPAIISDIKQNKEQLVSLLKNSHGVRSFSSIGRASARPSYPLSSAQKRLYFLQELDKQSIAYNIPQIIELKDLPDVDRLTNAFRTLIARHSALRTSFIISDKEPVQCIADEVQFLVDQYEASTVNDFHELVRQLVKPFDLSKGPLLRASIVRVVEPAPRTFLIIDLHHIITDGGSNRILASEIFSIYSGQELAPVRLQYVDYVEWLVSPGRQAEIVAQKDFWHDQFSGDLQPLRLPLDFKREYRPTSEGGVVNFTIDGTVLDNLRVLAKAQGATTYMLFLSLCNVWLSKITGQSDIVIGCPVSGRNHADIENIIGLFINTVPLRNRPESYKTFREFLREVADNTLHALDHQDYSFEDLVNSLDVVRDVTRNPLFDVLLKVDEVVFTADPKLGSMEYKVPFNPHTKFDLSIQVADVGTSFKVEIIYNSQLFTAPTLEKLAEYFIEVTKIVSNDPDIEIRNVSLRDETTFNDLSENLSDDSRLDVIQEKIRKSFDVYSDHVAIEYKDSKYSYQDLRKATAVVVNELKHKNIHQNTYVGVLCEDRYNLIVSVLGVTMSRCVFVPLHSSLPEKKIADMIGHLGLKHILTDRPELLEETATLSALQLHDVRDWMCNKTDVQLVEEPSCEPEDPLYVYFTSGSTGTPKAIVGKNKSLSHFVDWETGFCNVTGDTRVSQLIAPGFDAFLRDLFVPLCSGATLCIPSDETSFVLDDLPNWIEQNRISLIHCVPSIFRLINTPKLTNDDFKSVRHILLSGEEIIPHELTNWFKIFGSGISLVNLYGATETTMVKASYTINASDTTNERISIGKPIANTKLLVLDRNLQPCPALVEGEIYIRTPYRTLGYYDRSMNDRSFIPNKWSTDESDLLYRTGDLGRRLLDGNFQFLGRSDDQIKIKGNRVELSEINNRVASFSMISTCVSVLRTNNAGHPIICSYFQSPIAEDTLQLRVHLAAHLPVYAMPGYVCQLKSIPLLSNGKVDKKALPEPVFESQSGYVAPRNDLEEQVACVWSEVLDVANPGVTDNFFAMGGDSLRSVLIATRLKAIGYQVSIRDIFNSPTIGMLATILQDRVPSTTEAGIKPAEKREYYPLSSAQKRQLLDHVIDRSSLAFNMYNVFEISKALDIAHLKEIFRKLTQRHSILRTSFSYHDNDPVQVVHDDVNFHIVQIDAEDFDRPDFSFKRAFDLSSPPLFRVGLVVGGRVNLLLIDIHHIVSDGVSNLILLKEFEQLANGEKLQPAMLQYTDYAVWHNEQIAGDSYRRQQDYWLQVFKEPIPKLQLFQTQVQSGRADHGRSICFQLGEKLSRRMLKMAKGKSISIFSLLLAIQGVVLHKLSGLEDIIIGFPSTGRNHAGTEKMVGVFINTIALRLHPKGDMMFNDFLTDVSHHLIEALDNQDFQFHELIEKLKLERDNRRNPLFNILMVMQNHTDSRSASLNFSDSGDVVQETDNQSVVNDLFIRCIETTDNVLLNFQYRTDVFSRDSIQKFFNYFREVSKCVLENEDTAIDSIRILNTPKRAPVLALDSDFDW